MEPVEHMVDTAESIAAGDLTQRVAPLNPRTELGRLSTSLNTMLTHIEDAVELEREGQERLRQFVGDASHELRTPVTAIAGYAELRKKGALESAEAKDKAWSRIEAESSRMKRLIEDLLKLARLGQSHPLDLQQVDLAEIARNAAADHAAIDVERPVALSGPDSVTLVGDEHRLHQVVSSLLTNARMHTPPGTEIEITVADMGDTVELVVADSGPGIPDEALDDVFERFYRADPSRSRASGGSGLGLSIVRAIVGAHGGQVSAVNGAAGGATIRVTLPTGARGANTPS
jgi:two-component system OmpR family sensor kinase